jgi:hypothetical protein
VKAAVSAVTAGTQAPLPLVSDSGLVTIGLAVTGQTTSGDVDSSEHERTSRTVNTVAERDASHSPVPHPAALFTVETHKQTIDARSKKYGNFKAQAAITQNIKVSYSLSENWQELPDDMRESLDCIATKISRILNGDFCHPDSWHDIAGYAMLIEDRLRKAQCQADMNKSTASPSHP